MIQFLVACATAVSHTLIVTEYYRVEDYDTYMTSHTEEIYMNKFKEVAPHYMSIEGATFVVCCEDSQAEAISTILRQSANYSARHRVFPGPLDERATRVSAGIARDCPRKKGISLATDMARKLGGVWFNKFACISRVYRDLVARKELSDDPLVLWADFGVERSYEERYRLAVAAYMKEQPAKLPTVYISHENLYRVRLDFGRRAPVNAIFAARLMVFRGPDTPLVYDALIDAGFRMTNGSNCFDEETSLAYAYVTKTIDILVFDKEAQIRSLPGFSHELVLRGHRREMNRTLHNLAH